jgi:4-hydroxymandelate oxidase
VEPAVQPVNVFDYEALACERLEPAAWAYFSGGAGDELTLRANRAAYDRIPLMPRVLRGVRTPDLGVRVLGHALAMPILVAPMSAQGNACPQGECATAAAAGAAGTLMVASTESTRALEEIAGAATGPLWFQLYVLGDRERAAALVRRAEAAGFRAIVLTVDLPVGTRIERALRTPFAADAVRLGNFAPGADLADVTLTWDDVAWLRSVTSLPLVLKGVLHPEDAAEAAARGVDAIVVSNHGGRALDGLPPTIEALPAVVAAVSGRCEVYCDGGIRRGTDALKALALGARAVLVGRPILWGLAVGGADEARRVLDLLRRELEVAMATVGRASLAELDPSLIRHPAT